MVQEMKCSHILSKNLLRSTKVARFSISSHHSAERSLFTLVLYMDRFVSTRRKKFTVHVYVDKRFFLRLFSEESFENWAPKSRAPAVPSLTAEPVQTVIDPWEGRVKVLMRDGSPTETRQWAAQTTPVEGGSFCQSRISFRPFIPLLKGGRAGSLLPQKNWRWNLYIHIYDHYVGHKTPNLIVGGERATILERVASYSIWVEMYLGHPAKMSLWYKSHVELP